MFDEMNIYKKDFLYIWEEAKKLASNYQLSELVRKLLTDFEKDLVIKIKSSN